MQADLEDIPLPVLIGDIGGTNARFAVIDDEGAARRETADRPDRRFRDHRRRHRRRVLKSDELRPRSAMLALAGPIAGDAVHADQLRLGRQAEAT